MRWFKKLADSVVASQGGLPPIAAFIAALAVSLPMFYFLTSFRQTLNVTFKKIHRRLAYVRHSVIKGLF